MLWVTIGLVLVFFGLGFLVGLATAGVYVTREKAEQRRNG
jgi:hypothetical protein